MEMKIICDGDKMFLSAVWNDDPNDYQCEEIKSEADIIEFLQLLDEMKYAALRISKCFGVN